MQKDPVKSWNHVRWSIALPVDVRLAAANSDLYHELMIPGGVINPDTMRLEKSYVFFARKFLEAGKTVGDICYRARLMIETGMISGKELTSYRQ
ncbi:MAG: DJ-1/PfpI family protein [Ferruginibacter sp.]